MNKYIVIMRHGNASFQAETDALRPLTDQGKQECTQTFLSQESLFKDVSRVIVSPYLRAQQSLDAIISANEDIVRSQWHPERETWDTLTPESDISALSDQLIKHYQAHKENLLLVSHMPLVGALTEYLSSGAIIHGMPFTTGQLVILRFQDIPLPGCCEILKLSL